VAWVTDFSVRPAVADDRDPITALIRRSWGTTTSAAHGTLYDAAELPALVAVGPDGDLVGVLTYVLAGGDLEVVTLDAVARHVGVGTALLSAGVEVARQAGAGRLWLVTTNDNLDGLRFYQRRGMRIAAVVPGAVDYSREHLKPEIGVVGDYGIEIHDEITLEIVLATSDPAR
jgi:GNAT superfamily N-acetyltransferase